MYAVVSSGGKQYRVEAGGELIIERPGVDDGATITFDRVLLVGDGEAVTVGTPTVKGATVSGTVLGEALGPKLIIFKFKQKATYRRKNGHRQHLTRVRIDEINANGKSTKADKPDTAKKPDKADDKPAAETAAKKPARKPAAKASTAATKTTKTDASKAKPKAAPRERAAKPKTEE
ncbi:MAG: 50S ribosomal protein L21 [Candidatus Limnocylindria bacterium]